MSVKIFRSPHMDKTGVIKHKIKEFVFLAIIAFIAALELLNVLGGTII